MNQPTQDTINDWLTRGLLHGDFNSLDPKAAQRAILRAQIADLQIRLGRLENE